ncbi:MAG: sigma-54 dependent transcriptional regulator [Rhodobacteraceae bacterium]|nr:sigma-54 dependent transcriptional regulator [Paracoccaceae bacterium]
MDDILIVDDNSKIRSILAELLQNRGYKTREANSGSSCLKHFFDSKPSLVLLDIRLSDPEMDGIEVLSRIRKNDAGTPIIVMSGHGTIEIAVKAMQMGAYDYLEKPIMTGRLMNIIKNSMELVALRRRVMQQPIDQEEFPVLIGSSPRFIFFKNQLDEVAKNLKARVLLNGPQGSGKSAGAKYIHLKSQFANGPFITVNLPTIASDQVMAALFGKVTDSSYEHGYFDMAEGGCLYLKEITSLPMPVQRQLAQVLALETFYPVGIQDGTQNRHRFNIKIIASTHQDFSELPEDFIYPPLVDRLSAFTIKSPPLSAIRDDIPELANFFLYSLHKSHGWPLRELSKEAEKFMVAMEWSGNIRQLKNIIERILISNQTEKPISLDELAQSSSDNQTKAHSLICNKFVDLSLKEAREEFEREFIITQINRFNGSITHATKAIGIERTALHRKMKSLGIEIKNVAGNRKAVYFEKAFQQGGDDNS